MNQVVKAYFFIPSGFKNFLDHAFDGWRFVFFLYLIFALILAYEASSSIKEGLYILSIPVITMITLSVLSVACSFAIGAREPLIKGMRLAGLCLPPLGLAIFFLARQSLLAYFAIYPVILFIYGAAFLGSRSKFLNIAAGAVTIALAGATMYIYAVSADSILGQRLTFDGYKVILSEAPKFTAIEKKVYSYILLSTPDLGHIPQVDEIADSLKLSRVAVRNSLMALDEKGRVVLGADSEIRYAYPWAEYNQGYLIFIRKANESRATGPVFAASALHALSIGHLFKGADIRIVSRMKDTGDQLSVDFSGDRIESANFPEAQIYKSDIFSEIEFYSSPAGAKGSYRGRYDSTRLLNLERAIITAIEMLEKKTAGAL